MRVRLEDLGIVPSNFRFELDSASEGLIDVPGRPVGSVHADFQASRDGSLIRIEGRLSGTLERECYRCLKAVANDFDFRFEAGFAQEDVFSEQAEKELSKEDLSISVMEGQELDLTEVAREQLLLALPESVLCDDGCAGLCETCGKDLNVAPCECGADAVDPRWKGLEDLKRNLGS